VSLNIVAGLDYARSVSASILKMVGRGAGYTVLQACVIIPTMHPDWLPSFIGSVQESEELID
jgi:hypothetical protein